MHAYSDYKTIFNGICQTSRRPICRSVTSAQTSRFANRIVVIACCAWAAAIPVAMHAGGFDNLIIPVQDELLTYPTEESILIRQETSAEESGIVELPDAIAAPMSETKAVPAEGNRQLGSDRVLTNSDGEANNSLAFVAESRFSTEDSDFDEEGYKSSFVSDGLLNRMLGEACPRFVAQVDALMLWQGNIASRPLLANASGVTVLDANQAQTTMTAGPRYALFFNVDKCTTIEGNYFNVGSFVGEAPVVPAGIYTGIGLPAPLPTTATAYTLLTSGRFQSAELNGRRRTGGPVTLLAGFRWLEWNQQLQLTDSVTAPTTATTSQTGNDLYGGQLGIDLSVWNAGGPLTVNAIGKSGVFYNNAYQRTSDIISVGMVPTVRGPVAAVAEQTAFFGEVGANSSLQLNSWLSWRLGYSLFWLSGLAIPANQLALTDLTSSPPAATINTHGSVLLHGVTTGLEARW
ncbi:MAG: hypothetical protein CK530_10275 [Planctomycetaceae bacterium]|nr:MAG: hypothetical protein CK530_10275 [Planctomycetaceae bacterium]